MERTRTGPSRHRWNLVMAACWGLLGLWVVSTGRTWLGLAQIALAVAYVSSATSSRVEAWNRAPLLSRKR